MFNNYEDFYWSLDKETGEFNIGGTIDPKSFLFKELENSFNLIEQMKKETNNQNYETELENFLKERETYIYDNITKDKIEAFQLYNLEELNKESNIREIMNIFISKEKSDNLSPSDSLIYLAVMSMRMFEVSFEESLDRSATLNNCAISVSKIMNSKFASLQIVIFDHESKKYYAAFVK